MEDEIPVGPVGEEHCDGPRNSRRWDYSDPCDSSREPIGDYVDESSEYAEYPVKNKLNDNNSLPDKTSLRE